MYSAPPPAGPDQVRLATRSSPRQPPASTQKNDGRLIRPTILGLILSWASGKRISLTTAAAIPGPGPGLVRTAHRPPLPRQGLGATPPGCAPPGPPQRRFPSHPPPPVPGLPGNWPGAGAMIGGGGGGGPSIGTGAGMGSGPHGAAPTPPPRPTARSTRPAVVVFLVVFPIVTIDPHSRAPRGAQSRPQPAPPARWPARSR